MTLLLFQRHLGLNTSNAMTTTDRDAETTSAMTEDNLDVGSI